jgi:ATP-dependent DNA helicase RecG
MLTLEELLELLSDIESYRVERTEATTDTDKFRQAICAFANDMPGVGRPGYLVVGARDDGSVAGTDITDQLLLNLASHRDSGQIVPLPAINVEKMSLPDGDVAVVEVLPSDMPPVRYKGRVHIRTGPRKGIATEQEERVLSERRVSNARTFDLRPCLDCDSEQLVLSLFRLDYRTAAVAPEILEENKRDTIEQMISLGLWDRRNDCATNVGALLFSQSPLNWFPGAYIQYVHYDGTELESEIRDQRSFSGDLITVLRELDAFLKTLFPTRPVEVTSLREESRSTYPMGAIRELLMNAIMHRDYQANSPVRFYQFSDRIEIQNPGGLYGEATAENFPHQNAYRNPKVAEAMNVLGYVNRFGRGIAKSQELLQKNGNPPAEFDIDQTQFFLVTLGETQI